MRVWALEDPVICQTGTAQEHVLVHRAVQYGSEGESDVDCNVPYYETAGGQYAPWVSEHIGPLRSGYRKGPWCLDEGA
jgi:hypothetical protein